MPDGLEVQIDTSQGRHLLSARGRISRRLNCAIRDAKASKSAIILTSDDAQLLEDARPFRWGPDDGPVPDSPGTPSTPPKSLRSDSLVADMAVLVATAASPGPVLSRSSTQLSADHVQSGRGRAAVHSVHVSGRRLLGPRSRDAPAHEQYGHLPTEDLDLWITSHADPKESELLRTDRSSTGRVIRLIPRTFRHDQVLATYRLALQNRVNQIGSPPYTNCPKG